MACPRNAGSASAGFRLTLIPYGDRSPLQALKTDSGARAVEEILLGFEQGILA